MVMTEAVAAEDRSRRVDAPQVVNFPAVVAEAAVPARSNPYAMGYMGAANGSKRTLTLWKRNRVTPIPGN